MDNRVTTDGFVRLREIVGRGGLIPVSRATFYAWVAAGKLPKPTKLGRVSVWRRGELLAAVEGGLR